MTKFAFDLRGVIVNKETETIIDEAISSVRMTVEKFTPSNVYIISKAKDKWIKLNRERLKNTNFFERTGMLKTNLYFVNEYEDKETMCKKLGIDYMIDDSVKVIRYLTCNSFLFGTDKYMKCVYNHNTETTCLPTWKHLRKEIAKIKN